MKKLTKNRYNKILALAEETKNNNVTFYIKNKEEKKMTLYSFDCYKKEHLRYAWLSGRYTDEQLRKKYYDEYKQYCINHKMIYEV